MNQIIFHFKLFIYEHLPIRTRFFICFIFHLKLNIKNSLVFLPNKFDRDWCASTLIYSEENYIEKQDGQHGIVFLKNPLHEINEYVEFLVKIKIASHCSSHIFIGVLDKTKYKKEYLSKLK